MLAAKLTPWPSARRSKANGRRGAVLVAPRSRPLPDCRSGLAAGRSMWCCRVSRHQVGAREVGFSPLHRRSCRRSPSGRSPSFHPAAQAFMNTACHPGPLGRNRRLLLDHRTRAPGPRGGCERQPAARFAPRLVHVLSIAPHAQQQPIALSCAIRNTLAGDRFLEVEVISRQRLGSCSPADDLRLRCALRHGEAALHDLPDCRQVDQRLHRRCARYLVLAVLDRLGRLERSQATRTAIVR